MFLGNKLRKRLVQGSYLILPVCLKAESGTFSCEYQKQVGGGESDSHLTHCLRVRLLPALGEGNNGYMVLRSGDILTGDDFRQLREERGAWLLTDEPDCFRRVLGLAPDEVGVETEWR